MKSDRKIKQIIKQGKVDINQKVINPGKMKLGKQNLDKQKQKW